MNPKNRTTTLLLTLLLILSLGCTDTPTEPELTEEDIARIVDQKLAEIIGAEDDLLTPAEIATIALKSTIVLLIKKTDGRVERGSGFVIGDGKVATVFHYTVA